MRNLTPIFALLSVLIFAATACDAGPETPETATTESGLTAAKGDNPNGTFCAGIAGIQCPYGQTCKLDGDYPDAGGVCIGHAKMNCAAVKCMGCGDGEKAVYSNGGGCCPTCVPDNTSCTEIGLCVEGYSWDEAKCGCVKDAGPTACGDATCGAGVPCCNSSCGICGEVCTQQACLPTM